MIIVGHHTCSQEGSIEDIERNGPFLSIHLEDDPQQHKFLGTGYYFWDNNVGMAHSHGQNNYRRKYHIFEGELDIPEDDILDLAGNRIDMIHFQDTMDRISAKEPEREWSLAHYIEFLKERDMFPYRAIRAVDTGISPKKIIKFVTSRRNYINLDPVFIICLLDCKPDMMTSFKHIKTFP